MATTKFVNRARMLTSTTGTGTSVVLTTAVDGYFTLAEAGLRNGDVVDYIIEQGFDFEIQHDQTYSSSGPSLSRGTPAASKVGGVAGTSKINLNGSAQVAIVGLAKSFDVNTFTAKATPATNDILWGHSTADGARRAIPVSGILGLAPTSGLVLLNSGTLSNAASLDVVLSSYNSYRGLQLELIALVPAQNDRELWLRVSTNGGTSYATSGYRYVNHMFRDGASPFDNRSPNATSFLIAGHTSSGEAVSNDATAGGATVTVRIMNQTSSKYPMARWETVFWGNSQNWRQTGSGTFPTGQATDAIRVLFESGNIASGSWALYGYT